MLIGGMSDQQLPQLYRLPPGVCAHWENLTHEPIELLVIPLQLELQFAGLIWVAKRRSDRQFDLTDLQIVTDMAAFATNAMRLIHQKQVHFQFCQTRQEAGERRDVYLAGLAHELRHPLAPLKNAVAILCANSPPTDECDKASSVIELHLSQLTHLIDDLLEISRLFLNKLAVRKERVLLSNLLYRSIEAALANELRHPLGPLQNAVQVLRSNCPSEGKCDWAGTVIEQHLGQLNQLIDDLLDISRIFLDELELRKERVYLSTVLNKAIEASRPSITRHQHELIVMRDNDSLPLEADPSRLGQIFVRLLNNAATYTNPGGRVWLTTGRDGGHAVVTIRDTGIGLPATMFSRAFTNGVCFATSPQHAEGGLGISLELVKQLVKLHGGTVHAQSQGIGHGSEFVVRLPLEEAVKYSPDN